VCVCVCVRGGVSLAQRALSISGRDSNLEYNRWYGVSHTTTTITTTTGDYDGDDGGCDGARGKDASELREEEGHRHTD